MKFTNKPIEDYVNSLDFSGFNRKADCDTIHPMVEASLDGLEDSTDFNTLWKTRLSDLERQIADCLAEEAADRLLLKLPQDVACRVEKHLRSILVYTVRSYILTHKVIASEFGEE